MVAADFLQDPQVRQWLDGVEPAWTLLTFDSLRALRQEPSAGQTAIRIANDLSADEIASSAVARNTFILLRQAIERGGLPLTATGNLSRAVVAEMCELIEWPGYDQADAFRLHKVINEPDFLPLHIVRLLAEAAKLVRTQRGKLVATPLGKIDAQRRAARQLTGDPVSSCVLAHGSRVFRPRPARLMAAGGHRHRAVVAIGFRRRLANQREADAALHHPGTCHVFGNMGQDVLRHGGAGSCDRCCGSDCSNTAAKRSPTAGSRRGIIIARPHYSIACSRSMSKWILRRVPVTERALI